MTCAIRWHHHPPIQRPFQFRFEWAGNWKLTRITLPSDAIDMLSAAAKNQDSLGTPLSSKVIAGPSTAKPAPAVSERASQPLRVVLVSKGFKEKNIRAGDYEDGITMQLIVTNILDKDIRAFDGILSFTDLLDNEILSLKIAINESLEAGSVLSWNGEMKYNQFMEKHQRLRNERQENLKITFATRKVLFGDGTSKEY